MTFPRIFQGSYYRKVFTDTPWELVADPMVSAQFGKTGLDSELNDGE